MSENPDNIQRRGGESPKKPDYEEMLHAMELRLRELERLVRFRPPEPLEVFEAETTDSDGATHAWKEVINDGGSVVDFTDGRVVSDPDDDQAAIEINGWENVPDGLRVRMMRYPSDTGHEYQFAVPIPAPPLQDGTKSYGLVYDKATQALAWWELDDCG